MARKYEKIFRALVQYGFLPRATKHADEIPPLFNSQLYTPDIAREIASHPLRKGQGYDVVRVSATRHNLAMRQLSIPHPAPYSHLCTVMVQEWSQLKHISKNSRSRARPSPTKGERRFAMTETSRLPAPGVKDRYIAKADIGQFYDSIYTHAIAWALVGQKLAKATTHTKPEPWYNALDRLTRFSKRNETIGVTIGPATSTVVGELLLGAVDRELARFNYTRFVDDYVAYCKSETEALDFLNALRYELNKYNLAVNPRKTKIHALPVSTTPKWIRELRRLTPSRLLTSSQEIEDILDESIELIDEDIDTSALVWALRAAEPSFSSLQPHAIQKIRARLLHLAARRAPVVPFLCRFYSATETNPATDRLALKSILRAHLSEGRTDCGLWLTYLLLSHDLKLGTNLIDELIARADTLTLTLMATSTSEAARKAVKAFALELTKATVDNYDRDRYWLLLYEMHRLGEISVGSYADPSFDIMKREGVTFVDWNRKSLDRSELRLPRLSGPFATFGASGSTSPD